jgi:hypothetical protein
MGGWNKRVEKLCEKRFTFFSYELLSCLITLSFVTDEITRCLFRPYPGETMAENLNIPDELQGTYKRLMYRVPEKLRSDSHTQKIIQLYLKLGGEKLARQHIETIKLRVREEERQRKAEADASEQSDIEDDSIDPFSSALDSL